MNAPVETVSPSAVRPRPTGPSAAEAWDAICRGLGIVPLTAEEAAKLPPWKDGEADELERVINEAFEQPT